MKKLAFFFFCVFCLLDHSPLEAQEKTVRFDQNALEEYRSQSAFDYDRNIAPVSSPFFEFIAEVLGLLGKFLSSTVGIVIIILLIGSAIYLAAKRTQLSKAKKEAITILETDEGQTEIVANFYEAYKKAKGKHNYDLALRFLFLQLLNEMQDLSHIELHQDKTNRQYYSEMPANLRQDFLSLATLFEASRYGHFQLEAQELHQAEGYYDSLLKQKHA